MTDIGLDPLPPGITSGIDSDGQRADLAKFQAAAHHAARSAGGRIDRFELDRPCTNYVHVVLDLPGRTIAALCNRAYPLVAFSDEPDSLYMTRRYVAIPELASAFAEAAFLPVPLSVLTAPPSMLSLGALSKAERTNILYWIRYGQLSQAGDVLYNDWD